MAEQTEERSLASRIRLAVVRLNRRLRAQRMGEGVTLTQISALSTLYKCGELAPGQLAVKEGVRPPSMTRVIAGLEELGYLTREPHPHDGRQAIVQLTEQGHDYVRATISAKEAWLDQQLATCSESERVVLGQAADIIERIAEK